MQRSPRSVSLLVIGPTRPSTRGTTMRKLLPTTLLGIAGLTAFGLVAMSSPTLATASDEAAKREDDAPSLVLVADDDDDDTNDDDDDDTQTNSPSYTGQSRDTNDNTNSRVTDVSRDRDKSRGDKTRDWTRDGGDKTRDKTANNTNDRSRNDTRR